MQTNALAAATGFYSTAKDLSRYAAAHFLGDATLLADASKREMQQPYWHSTQTDTHYGLGFTIVDIGERRLVGHSGGFPGFVTRTMFDPKDRLVIVVLTNASRGAADQIGAELYGSSTWRSAREARQRVVLPIVASGLRAVSST